MNGLSNIADCPSPVSVQYIDNFSENLNQYDIRISTNYSNDNAFVSSIPDTNDGNDMIVNSQRIIKIALAYSEVLQCQVNY
jgi:hypothetical protein